MDKSLFHMHDPREFRSLQARSQSCRSVFSETCMGEMNSQCSDFLEMTPMTRSIRWSGFSTRGESMTQRGRASFTEQELDDTDVPVGSNVGTVAGKLVDAMLHRPDMRNHIAATAAMLTELFTIVGTPAFILLFVQFFREIELARAWLASPRQGHPHDLLETIPLRKEPSYRSVDLGAVRPVMSANFVMYCDSFYSLLSHLENTCTEANDEKLFRFLCEVQVLLDMLAYVVRWDRPRRRQKSAQVSSSKLNAMKQSEA